MIHRPELRPNQSQGTRAVMLILLAGILLAGYAWWHAYHRGQRSLHQWGSDVASLIRYAPTVELWQLQRSADDGSEPPELLIDGWAYSVSNKVDISRTRGLVHARHALVEDASFIWDSSPIGGTGNWSFALHFAGEGGQATIAFDIRNGYLVEAGARQSRIPELRLRPELASTYAVKSTQWLAESSDSAAKE
jgi:hypothetical protein